VSIEVLSSSYLLISCTLNDNYWYIILWLDMSTSWYAFYCRLSSRPSTWDYQNTDLCTQKHCRFHSYGPVLPILLFRMFFFLFFFFAYIFRVCARKTSLNLFWFLFLLLCYFTLCDNKLHTHTHTRAYAEEQRV